MLPLFEMMMKAQNGDAMDAMAKQFGLAQEQMQQAMAALMPAFSTGLKRSAANPYDFSSLMAAAGSGNYAKYFEDMTKAFSPQGIADGNNALGMIFGSKDVSRAVAAQAEQMSGIGQEVYKQMLPVIANTMMGGFFKQIAGQFQAAGDAISKGNPPDFFGQWMEAAGMKEKPKAESNPFLNNPFTQGFQSFIQQAGAANAGQGANPFANPFLDMFVGSMTRDGATPTGDTPTDKPSAASATAADANPFAGLFNQMFDSGVEVQKSYQKNVESIFDSYMSSLRGSGKTDR
ncbi:DUF937 domain-containing protein [Rhizobium sp. LjRoot254]|uniref:DUF937 domain-containing protein n=1 Tax=Rhizobium sp. LjRoot254 TaxID=3342297 RepID=UPI003ECF113C